jgi:putative membrane protein
MTKLVIRFLLSAAAIYLIARYIPGIAVRDTQTILIVAGVWSLIIMFVRPVLKVLTFPLTLVTLGLFSFVLNALLFALMAYVVPGFSVSGILPALIGSVVLSFVSSTADHLLS